MAAILLDLPNVLCRLFNNLKLIQMQSLGIFELLFHSIVLLEDETLQFFELYFVLHNSCFQLLTELAVFGFEPSIGRAQSSELLL